MDVVGPPSNIQLCKVPHTPGLVDELRDEWDRLEGPVLLLDEEDQRCHWGLIRGDPPGAEVFPQEVVQFYLLQGRERVHLAGCRLGPSLELNHMVPDLLSTPGSALGTSHMQSPFQMHLPPFFHNSHIGPNELPKHLALFHHNPTCLGLLTSLNLANFHFCSLTILQWKKWKRHGGISHNWDVGRGGSEPFPWHRPYWTLQEALVPWMAEQPEVVLDVLQEMMWQNNLVRVQYVLPAGNGVEQGAEAQVDQGEVVEKWVRAEQGKYETLMEE
ncbi:hypothetical protein JB92DRAFT_3137655 [Gautieria morchelliformis]|nr:hypothetical protein JB92DRAFT_3137655 [Gautieria morchelliformis]